MVICALCAARIPGCTMVDAIPGFVVYRREGAISTPMASGEAMDNLQFSEFVRLDGIPHARFFNRSTFEPIALSRSDCVTRLNNLRARGEDHEETVRAVDLAAGGA
jgi:hypothetical protein